MALETESGVQERSVLRWGGLMQKGEEDGTDVYSLSPQGVGAQHRLVTWIRETMRGMRI
jgi:hypothetical protein